MTHSCDKFSNQRLRSIVIAEIKLKDDVGVKNEKISIVDDWSLEA
jgi:hypothetical protein